MKGFRGLGFRGSGFYFESVAATFRPGHHSPDAKGSGFGARNAMQPSATSS